MNDDDEICLCFHVTRRKVLNYIRVERPHLASQLSDCFGAGTGCGWCRPFLARLLDQSGARPAGSAGDGRVVEAVEAAEDQKGADSVAPRELDAEQYARARSAYVRQGGGTPPAGATPVLPNE